VGNNGTLCAHIPGASPTSYVYFNCLKATLELCLRWIAFFS